MGFVVRLSYAGGVKRSVKSFNVFSEGPEGIILESMLEGYAEYYSAELSEKIQRGRNETELYFYCVMAKENRKFIL